MMTGAARTIVRGMQTLVPQAGAGVRILAYHLVGAGTQSPVDVPVDVFEAQLDSLDGRVQSLDEALERLEDEDADGDAATVVLTFDDAYANFYEEVYPRLVQRQLPALLYVPTGFVDGQQPAPMRGAEGLAACTWEQLGEMAASGLVTLGSHTVTHPSLTHIALEQAERELSVSRMRIEEMVEQSVPHFCYPRGLWSRRLEPLVAHEYATATMGGGGSITFPYEPLRLQRTSIRREMGADLRPIAGAQVWLEERLANIVRRIRN
jgi:peptidoglycan/xylan/chitin deacetylase (PgdA/CDA1 family)